MGAGISNMLHIFEAGATPHCLQVNTKLSHALTRWHLIKGSAWPVVRQLPSWLSNFTDFLWGSELALFCVGVMLLYPPQLARPKIPRSKDLSLTLM